MRPVLTHFCSVIGSVPTALLLMVGSADRIPLPVLAIVSRSRPCSSSLPAGCAISAPGHAAFAGSAAGISMVTASGAIRTPSFPGLAWARS